MSIFKSVMIYLCGVALGAIIALLACYAVFVAAGAIQ